MYFIIYMTISKLFYYVSNSVIKKKKKLLSLRRYLYFEWHIMWKNWIIIILFIIGYWCKVTDRYEKLPKVLSKVNFKGIFQHNIIITQVIKWALSEIFHLITRYHKQCLFIMVNTVHDVTYIQSSSHHVCFNWNLVFRRNNRVLLVNFFFFSYR